MYLKLQFPAVLTVKKFFQMAAGKSTSPRKAGTFRVRCDNSENSAFEGTSVASSLGSVPSAPASNLPHVYPLTRPQAIVTPMSSKPLCAQAMIKDDSIDLKPSRVDGVVELTDDGQVIKRTIVVTNSVDEDLDKSNNNLSSVSETICVDNKTPKTFHSFSRLSNTSAVRQISEPPKTFFPLGSTDVEVIYGTPRQRTPVRRRNETVENAAVLSPVIEVPATPGKLHQSASDILHYFIMTFRRL